MKALFAVLLIVFPLCMAQQPTPTPPPKQETPAPQQPQEQRQPVEAPALQPIEPVEIPAPSPDEPEYRGPTILSRGGQPSVQRSSELFRFRPFVTIEGIYDTGLVTVGVNELGQLPFTDAYGAQASFGVTGMREWRRSSLALDYRGSARHYTEESYYDGSDHTFLLRYENRVSRRWLVSLTQGAASLSRGMMMPYGMTQTYNPTFGVLTGDEFFDGRSNVLLSTGQAVYQHTPRLSFGMSAAGFFVGRRSDALVGATGWTALGDMAYRLGRYSTAGLEYSFSQFDFRGAFGNSYVHGLALNYARRLSRNWELSLRGGALRVETSRLQVVQLDPAIAAILGLRTGVSIFHGITYLPQYTVRLSRSFRRSELSASYLRLVSPGNGVYLTAANEMFDISYRNQASRRVAFGLGAATSRLKGVSQDIQDYRGYTARASLSVRLKASLSAISRFDVRDQRVGGTLLDREAYRVTVGFGWTPDEYPVSVW